MRNYRGIAKCDVQLGPLTFLVVPERLGQEQLRRRHPFRRRQPEDLARPRAPGEGGINEVRRRSRGHPTHFSSRMDLALEDAGVGHYAVTIGSQSAGGFDVTKEECEVLPSSRRVGSGPGSASRAARSRGASEIPARISDRPYPVNVSGRPEFRPV